MSLDWESPSRGTGIALLQETLGAQAPEDPPRLRLVKESRKRRKKEKKIPQ